MMKNISKKAAYIIIICVCLLIAAAEGFFTHAHGPQWRAFPGASMVIAFVGGWALILLSKKLLGPILQRNNDYYDERNNDYYDEKGGEDDE